MNVFLSNLIHTYKSEFCRSGVLLENVTYSITLQILLHHSDYFQSLLSLWTLSVRSLWIDLKKLFVCLFFKFVWFKQGDLAKKKIYPTLWWVKNCSTHTAATLITELCFKVVWSPCVMKSLTFGQRFLHCYLWIFQVVIQRRPSSRQHVFCGFCSVQLDCRGHQGSMSAPHEGNTFKGVWLLKIRFCVFRNHCSTSSSGRWWRKRLPISLLQ